MKRLRNLAMLTQLNLSEYVFVFSERKISCQALLFIYKDKIEIKLLLF